MHQWDVQLKTYITMLYVCTASTAPHDHSTNRYQWINISSIVYGPLIFMIKLSVLLQYLKIFVPRRKDNMAMFVAIQAVIWANFIFYTVNMAFLIALCSPREKIWNPFISTGRCFDRRGAFKSNAIFNVISDFTILLLPMRSVWKLHMPLRKKIGVSAVFSTGLL